MTSRLILYYSLKGNTKGLLDNVDLKGFDIVNINNQKVNLNEYDLILIGTSTYGRGVPPKPFFEIVSDLKGLKNKEVGLFGSGRSEYEYFCGALDLIEELVKDQNEILFKFKFEGYPRYKDIQEFSKLLKEVVK